MPSGQQRVHWNNAERASSNDHNLQGYFIARQRNEIIRSLCQVDWSPSAPGVTNLDQSALDSFPINGVVLDGLEAIVDTPGYVMITPGTMAGWTGQPADPGSDSGFFVVPSGGVASLLPTMVIAPNTGTVPRCDVIECRFNGTETATTEQRDVYNPASESFTPAILTKTVQTELQFRVRTGTPGAPPGGDYGWLPLAIAIVQPGLPLTQVDFYDVRPLLRDLRGKNRNLESIHGNLGALINRGSNHVVYAVSTDTTIPNTTLYGTAQAEFYGIEIAGYLMRNNPITPATAAQWGQNTAAVGGDGYSIALGVEVFVRGAATAIGPYNDKMVICACFPNLGLAAGMVPRCVRYTQAAVNNLTAEPARRRPQGINGIIQVFGQNQEGHDFQNGGNPYYASSLNSTGFQGCVGGAICIPIGAIDVDDYGYVNNSMDGVLYGAHIVDGQTYVQNQIVYLANLMGSVDIETDVTYEDESAGLTVPHAAFQDPLSRAGDRIEIDLAGLILQTVADVGAGHGGVHIIVTEDYFGTPVVHTVSEWFRSYVDASPMAYPINCRIPYTLTRGGTLRIEIRLYNSAGSTTKLWNPMSLVGNWGTYRRYR